MSKYLLMMIALFLSVTFNVSAQVNTLDSDGDGLLDYYEQFFGSDPKLADTDADGYNDYIEVINKYDPNAKNASWQVFDSDGDELWDYEEVLWGTDPLNFDSDYDGFSDKIELINGYDPNGPGKMPAWIKIDLGDQTVSYGNGPKQIDKFATSTGKRGYETPIGEYKILNKITNAWSRTYGLWMPYWMAFTYQGHGIHELPYWPSGYREGEDHLGKAVSHGCVRLGIGSAQKLYNWAEVGTKVIVQE